MTPSGDAARVTILLLVAAGLVVAGVWLRGSAAQGVGAEATASTDSTASDTVLGPFPVPDAVRIDRVLDPKAEVLAITAEDAIRIARADGSNLVGQTPRVQLVELSATSSFSEMDGFRGWIVLSTDVPGYLWPPYVPGAPTARPIIATHSYAFVSLDGIVVSTVQLTFQEGDEVPALP